MSTPVLIMLASGFSSRFGTENKLLTEFKGQPLCAHSAHLGGDLPQTHRLAIVPQGNQSLSTIYQRAGWSVLVNDARARGMSHSLKLGIQTASALQTDVAGICLADMPFIPQQHINRLFVACQTHDAAMSCCYDALMPPAAFRANLFGELMGLEGDCGAKSVFLRSENTSLIDLTKDASLDIDTQDDLAALDTAEYCHA